MGVKGGLHARMGTSASTKCRLFAHIQRLVIDLVEPVMPNLRSLKRMVTVDPGRLGDG